MRNDFLSSLYYSVVAVSLGMGLLISAHAQSAPTPSDIGKALGFTDAEIARIMGGEIVTKNLNEGSDKELAGVLAMLFKKPVAELAELALSGKLLTSDPNNRDVRSWKPDASADEVFAAVKLDDSEADEAKQFTRAAPGGKLNLSKEEIGRFKGLKTDQINAELRAILKARYLAYRQSGLKGIAPYARGGSKTASPYNELTLAIKETMTVAPRQDYFQALLDYPSNPLSGVEHEFFWINRVVENRPTFILAHRASRRNDVAALLTEEQYYVGHSYNSNFVAGGCLAVEGGTLVFYVNRTFTDQVAGMGSSLKHSIGRKQMLSEIAADLERVRGKLEK